ncbi:hypothetical protein [Corallococcus macrosporus]|uniref:hypothetical protein n=1 Tax=Corallococcus macrosporus TaxID=35 RepID=UPI001EFDB9FA|nr:hypothetical protein [Corallococcus macrosporus]
MRFVLTCLLVLLPASPALAELDSFGLGTGRDGALSVTTEGRVLNTATPLTDLAVAGARDVPVQSVSGFTAGGLVLLHQSGGSAEAVVASDGGTLALRRMGHWELARVEAVSASPPALRLTEPLAQAYTAPGAQAVTVPEYTNVLVGSGAPWCPGRGMGAVVASWPSSPRAR